jgi:acetamidase/formamidase
LTKRAENPTEDQSTLRLRASAETVHFGFYDASLRPVMEVSSGQDIWIETISADPEHDVPKEWLPKQLDEIFKTAVRGTGPHILTGPIAVRDARQGDILQVDILDVRLTQSYGYNIVSPAKGMFPDAESVRTTTIIPIELRTGRAQVTSKVSLQTRPFFGQMGVAPPPSWGRIDSRPPDAYGGNLDNKELLPGARLFLPVFNDGALFSVGDGHAAQGNGEVNQTAIETSLDGHFRLSVLKGRKLHRPMAVTPTHILTMAFHEDLNQAARLATRDMIEVLNDDFEMDFRDAYRLCSVAADLNVTQFVNGNRGIHVMLPRQLLEEIPSHGDLTKGL